MAHRLLALLSLSLTLPTILAHPLPLSGPPTYTCPAQPPGTCSLRLHQNVFEGELQYSCGIHDHTGAQLGMISGSCQPGLAITSPLPWTMDITAASPYSTGFTVEDERDRSGTGSQGAWVEFRYAAGYYGKGVSKWSWENGDLCVVFTCPGF